MGLLLAHSARALVRAHSGRFIECRALYVAIAFEILVIWPTTLYLYFAHADWSWLYFVDPRGVPRIVVLFALVIGTGLLIGGFTAGYVLVRAGKFWELWGTIVGIGALLFAVLFLLRARFLTYTTYEGFRRGAELLALSQVKLGYALVILFIFIACALGFALHQLSLAGKRIM